MVSAFSANRVRASSISDGDCRVDDSTANNVSSSSRRRAIAIASPMRRSTPGCSSGEAGKSAIERRAPTMARNGESAAGSAARASRSSSIGGSSRPPKRIGVACASAARASSSASPRVRASCAAFEAAFRAGSTFPASNQASATAKRSSHASFVDRVTVSSARSPTRAASSNAKRALASFIASITDVSTALASSPRPPRSQWGAARVASLCCAAASR
jgi:hypothetical protein